MGPKTPFLSLKIFGFSVNFETFFWHKNGVSRLRLRSWRRKIRFFSYPCNGIGTPRNLGKKVWYLMLPSKKAMGITRIPNRGSSENFFPLSLFRLSKKIELFFPKYLVDLVPVQKVEILFFSSNIQSILYSDV